MRADSRDLNRQGRLGPTADGKEHKPVRIAVCGGIGSGKSMVCKALRAIGYPVFDCDSEARRIMDRDCGIHERLNARIHPEAVVEGRIDRKLIARIVFNDSSRLAALNEIVHGAVRRELEIWADAHSQSRAVFVETAILRSSGLDRMVDRVWQVEAPESVREQRVMARNGLSIGEVRDRIRAQLSECPPQESETVIIINDGIRPVLPQIENLLNTIS